MSSGKTFFGISAWAAGASVVATAVLGAVWGQAIGWAALSAIVVALIGAVIAAVHHAEVIALRVGEPFGTLVLALAVTVIEASLIVAMMLSGGDAARTLARDAVFATVMIICNGVIGLCLLVGAWRHHVLAFRVEGTTPVLSVLTTLVTLTLVLPQFTISSPGPMFSPAQLIFAGGASLLLYLIFVFVQTVRHRDYFLSAGSGGEGPAPVPTAGVAWASFGLLSISLVAVVGLAKSMGPIIEQAVEAAAAPHSVIGIAIALLVLLPETGAALRAALRNRMQTSFNLALGSALATIGLTIPVVAATALILQLPLELGLPAKELSLLVLTILVSAMTLAPGNATVLQGSVHLVLFAVFLFLAVVP